MNRAHLNAWIIVAFSLTIAAGCGTTRGGIELPYPIPASKDPDFAATKFNRIAALVETDDFLLRGWLEDELGEAFQIWGRPVHPATRSCTRRVPGPTVCGRRR